MPNGRPDVSGMSLGRPTRAGPLRGWPLAKAEARYSPSLALPLSPPAPCRALFGGNKIMNWMDE